MSMKDEGLPENSIHPTNEQYSIEDDIIDLSAFSFDDVYTWLCEPLRNSSQSELYNLNTTLIDEQTSELDPKKYVDTRTFTRPKKRTRSILESTKETMRPLVRSIEETHPSGNIDPCDENPHLVPYESIPPMLRINSDKCHYNYHYELSDSAGTETFTKKSLSNGIDYSINSSKLNYCDNLMDISQPSLMNWSITSVGGTTDESKFDTSYSHIVIDCENIKPTLDTTFDVNYGDLMDEVPKSNSYNTYKKGMFSVENSEKSAEDVLENSNDLKDLTFTEKKVHEIEQHNNLKKVEIQSNLNSTFCKQPETKDQQTLSKLPLFFQKSNPNLLKSYSIDSAHKNSTFGFNKRLNTNLPSTKISQPNNTYQLGKAKSTSDQKLSELCRNTLLLQKTITKGSTESIESTQSVHSAPDLEDGLSAHSDSSHSLYNMQSTNMDRLHKVPYTSLNKTVVEPIETMLERTWISDEMPSPILKPSEKRPSKQQLDVTSSSPLNNNGSSQPTTTGHSKETATNSDIHNTTYRKSEIIHKPDKVERKSGLKPRIDWNKTSRIPNPVSGIPKPASRIPAPRFLKPKSETYSK